MKTMAESDYSSVYDFERGAEPTEGFRDDVTDTYEPVPRPFFELTKYEEIINDPSLSRGMHTPDYFLLVE